MAICKSQDIKNRKLDQKIQLYLQLFGAVCIEGPKWCGKTKMRPMSLYESMEFKGTVSINVSFKIRLKQVFQTR